MYPNGQSNRSIVFVWMPQGFICLLAHAINPHDSCVGQVMVTSIMKFQKRADEFGLLASKVLICNATN